MTTATLTKTENLLTTQVLVKETESRAESGCVFSEVDAWFNGVDGSLPQFVETARKTDALTEEHKQSSLEHFFASRTLWNNGRLEVTKVEKLADFVEKEPQNPEQFLYRVELQEVKPVTSVTRTGSYALWGNPEKDLTEADVLEQLREGWFYQNERDCLADRVGCRELSYGGAELEELELQLVEVAVARGTLKVTTVECFDQDVDDDGDAVYHHEFEYELTL